LAPIFDDPSFIVLTETKFRLLFLQEQIKDIIIIIIIREPPPNRNGSKET
jgi:hypothetical protein